MKVNTLFVIQATAIILIAGSLGGMFVYTDIYEDVQRGIVEVLCLSCIKLQPITSRDFTFETANGANHPSFVTDTLREEGIILIQYGEKACTACIEMIDNIIKPYFNLEFDKTKSHEFTVDLGNFSFQYIYIYVDDDDTSQELKDSYKIYDKDHIGGFPMFTIITIEYHHGGEIRPFYTSLYGKFEKNNNYPKMYQTFYELLEESNELYERNIIGFI